MKRMAFVLLGCFFLATATQAWAEGKLSVDITAIKFGTMKEGLVAEKTVTLTNSGDAPLRIDNVTTS
jgi:hypothetical protein